MINLLEGVPGSGKSYEAVVYHVLPALQSGRKVITNLPLIMEAWQFLYPDLVPLIELRRSSAPVLGKWDAEAANRGEQAYIVGEFDGEATGKTEDDLPCQQPPANTRLFGSVWDFYSTWRGKNNIGPLYVIDECHVSFPKITRRNPMGTPEQIIQWFKISRHFGADVLLMTQRMGALDEDIAGLAEFHVRVRKAAFLGRPQNYVRKTFAGLKGGEVSSEEREYLSQYFPLYKSHTQGSTVKEASVQDVNPAYLKWRKWSRIFFVLGALFLGWTLYKIFFADSKPKMAALQTANTPKPLLPSMKPAQPQIAPAPASVPSQEASKAPEAPSRRSMGPDPLENRLIHLTGCMESSKTHDRVCTLTVSQNGMPIFHITNKELEQVGFQFKYLGHCAAHLSWDGVMRAVVCDSPSVGMRVAGVKNSS
ncbi:zonular occludens toxin [Comamonas thiooxydans]|uniref:zonular occludens toxin domain-containing protein n=1 Tax=Comamonas thiooxydans TaxID=363952 RepID=UPI000A2EA67C|nr:zonular occludens toxin domain-containing protein [Comamonas thiooxydans]BDR10854.1 zonular occludens toxin [Comamonas thiooxydans]